ncbi:MAG: hypothetical protein ACPHCN_18425 [Mycobacterium sp.]
MTQIIFDDTEHLQYVTSCKDCNVDPEIFGYRDDLKRTAENQAHQWCIEHRCPDDDKAKLAYLDYMNDREAGDVA